jgi:hypothetical protein
MIVRNYNVRYLPHIIEKKKLPAVHMVKSTFYRISQYETVDGIKETYGTMDAPLIFTLFVSKSKDIVHCLKLSAINPSLLKRLLHKLTNDATREIELSGTARKTYETTVSKFPTITENAYRTYKLSGLQKVWELDMNIPGFTSTRDHIEGINEKYQVQNK